MTAKAKRPPVTVGPAGLMAALLVRHQRGEENTVAELLPFYRDLAERLVAGQLVLSAFGPEESARIGRQLHLHLSGTEEQGEYIAERFEEWNRERDALRELERRLRRRSKHLPAYDRGPVEAIAGEVAGAFLSGLVVGAFGVVCGLEPWALLAAKAAASEGGRLAALDRRQARRDRLKNEQQTALEAEVKANPCTSLDDCQQQVARRHGWSLRSVRSNTVNPRGPRKRAKTPDEILLDETSLP